MFSIHHVAIGVTDLEKSVPFYEQLGFEVVMQWQADDRSLSIVHMRLNGMLLELFCYAGEPREEGMNELTLASDLKRIGTRHFGLKVDDIEASRQRMVELGLMEGQVTVTRGRTGIKYFFLRDPDGLFIEVVQDDRALTPIVRG